MEVGLAAALRDGTRWQHACVVRVEAGRTRADLGECVFDRPGRRGYYGAVGRVCGVLPTFCLGHLA